MVSFQCDGCGDTIKKPQLDKHRNRCWATFSCIDCSTTFHGTEYKAHTSCISEAEKYQGALYKGKKGGQGGHAGNNAPVKNIKPQQAETAPAPVVAAPIVAEPVEEPTPAPAPTIHPSRTALLNGTHDPTFRPKPARQGFPSLHPGASYPPPKPFGRNAQRQQQMASTRNYATGMNGMGGGEMRSWGGSPEAGGVADGSSAQNDPSTSTPVVLSTEKISVGVPVSYDDGSEKKKKNKKRKGDKGGTGSRANSNALKKAEEAAAAAVKAQASPAASAPVKDSAQAEKASVQVEMKQTPLMDSGDAVKATAVAPAVIIPATPLASEAEHTRTTTGDSKKKRKADDSEALDGSSSSGKTAKKLRKALSSIASSQKPTAGSVPLASLIEQLSEQVSKKKKSDGVIDATAITQDIKVKFEQGAEGEGRWVLEV